MFLLKSMKICLSPEPARNACLIWYVAGLAKGVWPPCVSVAFLGLLSFWPGAYSLPSNKSRYEGTETISVTYVKAEAEA